MQVKTVSIDQVKPYGRNPRKNAGAVDAVARSIREFGFRQPIVVNREMVIVAGHTRWLAARRLGLKEVPVHVADLSPERERAYRLADNKVGEIAGWDGAALRDEVAAIGDELARASGFDVKDLEIILGPGSGPSAGGEDALPRAERPRTRRGDLWVLGRHRLACDDCAAGTVRVMAGAQADLLLTDPPYNVAAETYESRKESFRSALGRRKRDSGQKAGIEGDKMGAEEFSRRLREWFRAGASALRPGGAFYFFGADRNLGNYPGAISEAGLLMHQVLVWKKQRVEMMRQDFKSENEFMFYGWKPGARRYFCRDTGVPAGSVWTVDKPRGQVRTHVAQKPVELFRRAIEFSTKVGQIVVDIFAGSGTTVIAAEATNRIARVVEIDPATCDGIVGRWERYTGGKARKE